MRKKIDGDCQFFDAGYSSCRANPVWSFTAIPEDPGNNLRISLPGSGNRYFFLFTETEPYHPSAGL
ncbi:MAG: hypothetical protein WD077_03235 [Bacteroidia bacterium]